MMSMYCKLKLNKIIKLLKFRQRPDSSSEKQNVSPDCLKSEVYITISNRGIRAWRRGRNRSEASPKERL